MSTLAVSVLALGAAAAGSAACGSAGAPDASASGGASSDRAVATLVTVSANLLGSAELRKGDPDGRGTATISLNAANGKACWNLSVTGIAEPLSAHIHQGGRRQDGPVVIPLGAKYGKKGCVVAPKKSIRAVANHPGNYYVNVHTRQYLNGALRGQLRKNGRA